MPMSSPHRQTVVAFVSSLRERRPALCCLQVGLSDKLSSLSSELSGGQRRKLSVAIAFLGSPAGDHMQQQMVRGCAA